MCASVSMSVCLPLSFSLQFLLRLVRVLVMMRAGDGVRERPGIVRERREGEIWFDSTLDEARDHFLHIFPSSSIYTFLLPRFRVLL